MPSCSRRTAVPELLRPAPPVSWRDRVDAALQSARDRRGALVAALAGATAVAVAVVLLLRQPAAPAPLELPRASPAPVATATTAVSELVVHVAGAVNRSGLVRLPAGARVADAVDAAGGLRPDADVDRLNLAAPLTDGQRLYVPIRGQEVPPDLTGVGGSGVEGAG